ncbi:chemotaxis protein CheA [Fusibacter bizertensis]|uniref:Chemotaxis protein CheA n=1 Tax=Fusibacter bizertensis TaxID=1488331 RepID=A0ABT6N873_9FIRM|nr:chemotaxis protein CheA [Fusibacter bizertensis]MDH8676607.1 chemotaxis protein CheA [Fusibacter bizertensis]
MDMSQYLEIFIDESKEHLQTMNEILLILEGDVENLSHLGEIFRIAHTLKGMSGTMGFTKVADLTHKMENVLDLVRNGVLKVDSTIVDILFECFDALEEYIENLEKTGKEGDLDSSELVKKLAFIAENKSTVGSPSDKPKTKKDESVQPSSTSTTSTDEGDFHIPLNDIDSLLNKAFEMGVKPYLIKITLDSGCMLKAARAFIVFNTLERFGEILKSYPLAEEIEDERFDDSFEILYFSKLDESYVHTELMRISELSAVVVKPLTEIEFAVEEKKEDVEVDLEHVEVKESELKTKEDSQSKGEKGKTSKTVRVEIGRLDNLMNLVSELIIIKTRLEDLDTTSQKSDDQGNKNNMNEAIEYLERITTSLHDAVMKVRMVPVERTFNRFPRLVRDLSRELGKNIKLFMSGEETEVDRTVIDEIGDPLIHLIRNSLDHGIESPAERAKLGKEETGFVALRAYPDGNTVVIEVEDDGKGINPEVIKRKAIEKNIVTKEEADVMPDKELINLLFKAGFSTVDKVTDLSGRGVGLDVVKSKIEAINGTVEVVSNMGQGSKFVIRLPLTLAIIQALMVNLNEEKFAIPLNNIKEITTIETNKITMVQDQEVVLYRNKTLPIIRMKDVLDIEYDHEELDELIVVIVKKGDIEAGLVVDSLIGQQEIVIKSLGKYLTGIKAIAGATILGNGSVALIVDPNQLF